MIHNDAQIIRLLIKLRQNLIHGLSSLLVLITCLYKFIIVSKYILIDEVDYLKCIIGQFLNGLCYYFRDFLNIACCLSRILSQCADLISYYGEALTCLTCTCSLNACIQC